MKYSRRTLTILLVCLTVLLAGCAGWGTDGPADGDEDPAPNETGDLEDADDNATNEQDDEQTEAGVAGGEDETGTDETSDDGADTDEADTDADDDTNEASTDEDTSESNTDESDADEDESSTDDNDDADETDDASDSDANESDIADNSTDESDDADGDETSDSDEEDAEADDDESSDSDDAPTNDTEDAAPNDSDTEEPETHALTVYAGESVPVEGADITLERHSDGATTDRTTDENGTVEYTVIDGEYTVTGEDLNGETDSANVTINGEDEEVLLATLAPPNPDEHAVTLAVTDAQTDEPIEGAVLSATGDYHPNTGDMILQLETGPNGTANGEFFASTYDGSVYAEGYAEESVSIDLTNDTTLEYELEPTDTANETETNRTDGNTTSALTVSA